MPTTKYLDAEAFVKPEDSILLLLLFFSRFLREGWWKKWCCEMEVVMDRRVVR